MFLDFQPRKQIRRREPPPLPAPPPPVALTLVQARYDSTEVVLRLTFDRAVDVDAFASSAVTVGDGLYNLSNYVATAASLEAPEVVRIALEPTGPFQYTDVMMEASAATGIIAADDGGTWPGTPGSIVLPYG